MKALIIVLLVLSTFTLNIKQDDVVIKTFPIGILFTIAALVLFCVNY